MKQLKIHKVEQGPIELCEIPGFELEEGWLIVVLAEYEGELFTMELAHLDFDRLYEIYKHCNGPTIEPYIIGPYEEVYEGDLK